MDAKKVFIRKTDDSGRITLPQSVSDRLGIGKNDYVEIIENDDCCTVRKHVQRCVFCARTTGLVAYKGKFVCSECLNSFADMKGSL